MTAVDEPLLAERPPAGDAPTEAPVRTIASSSWAPVSPVSAWRCSSSSRAWTTSRCSSGRRPGGVECEGAGTVEVRDEVNTAFFDKMQDMTAGTVWAPGCSRGISTDAVGTHRSGRASPSCSAGGPAGSMPSRASSRRRSTLHPVEHGTTGRRTDIGRRSGGGQFGRLNRASRHPGDSGSVVTVGVYHRRSCAPD